MMIYIKINVGQLLISFHNRWVGYYSKNIGISIKLSIIIKKSVLVKLLTFFG
jgi:hypothetical protein